MVSLHRAIGFPEPNLAKNLPVEMNGDLDGTVELFDEKGMLPVSRTNDRPITWHCCVDVLKAYPRQEDVLVFTVEHELSPPVKHWIERKVVVTLREKIKRS